jgi:putative SOS response-associated peptidase YedK
MCGRYSFAIEDELIRERFGISVRSAVYKARYNCAPSQNLALISSESPEKLSFYRWGLIPSWAKDPSIGNRLINARGETILEKPSFRNAFISRRCLVLSDGFYEWQKFGKKTPFRITLKDSEPFAMAGIWEKWKDPDEMLIYSFSIITTSPNALLAGIHDRMPVILNKEDEKRWINPMPAEELIKMIRPFPAEMMKAYPVSKMVNSPANDIPEIWIPEK